MSRYLSKEGHNVLVSSRKKISMEKSELHGTNISGINHDRLLDSESFPDEIDVVIHLAAVNEIDCVKYPSEAVKINIDQTRMILENAISKGVKRFIYFSTVHVYGPSIAGDIDESILPRPAHPYAITHRAAEDYVIAAHDKKRINAMVIRLSNSFGAPVFPDVDRWTLLVNDICRQLVTTHTIKLNSNGCQFRDFITLTDVERCVGHLLSINPSESNIIFNLASGKSLTVLAMAELIASCYEEVTGIKVLLTLPENTTPTKEKEFRFNSERLKRSGYELTNKFEGELKELIFFCKKHFALTT